MLCMVNVSQQQQNIVQVLLWVSFTARTCHDLKQQLQCSVQVSYVDSAPISSSLPPSPPRTQAE